MTHSSTAYGQAGFTLIELLVSLTMLGIILALVTNALQVVSKGWDAHARQIEDLDMISRAADILQRDAGALQRVVSLPGKPNARFIFTGDTNRLSFIALEPPYPTEPGPYFIDYSIVPDKNGFDLVRGRAPFEVGMSSYPGATTANRVPLLEGPYDYRFAYADRENGALKWYARWPFDQRLPALIRLDIANIRSRQPASRPIVAAVRADAELGCISAESGPCSIEGDLKEERSRHKNTEKSPKRAQPRGVANASAP